MPARLLREGILDSEAVNALTAEAEVFYRRLMSAVDDFGRFDGRPAILRGRLYPLRVDEVRDGDIVRWAGECVRAGLIRPYEAGGKPYLLLLKLGPARAKVSKYPAPPADENTCAHPLSSENSRAQMQTDENVCAQVKADENSRAQMRPYSGSGSGSGSGASTGEEPPPPPAAGGRGKRPPPASPEVPAELNTPAFAAAWAEWEQHRKAKGGKLTPLAAAKQLKFLAGLGPERAAAAIEHSVRQNYTGIFEATDGTRPAGPGRDDDRRGRAVAEPGKYAHLDAAPWAPEPAGAAGPDLLGPAGGPPDTG